MNQLKSCIKDKHTSRKNKSIPPLIFSRPKDTNWNARCVPMYVLCVFFTLPFCTNKIVILLEKIVSIFYKNSTKQTFRKVTPLVMHCVQVLLSERSYTYFCFQ